MTVEFFTGRKPEAPGVTERERLADLVMELSQAVPRPAQYRNYLLTLKEPVLREKIADLTKERERGPHTGRYAMRRTGQTGRTGQRRRDSQIELPLCEVKA